MAARCTPASRSCAVSRRVKPNVSAPVSRPERLSSATAANGFAAFAKQPGIVHERHVTGSDRAAARHPAFRWANTMLANIKNSLLATHRVVGAKHLPRYLGAFAWRFNRRFVLKSIHERLAIATTTTPPMPYPLLKLAEARWSAGTELWEKMLANMVSAKMADTSGHGKVFTACRTARSCREGIGATASPPFDLRAGRRARAAPARLHSTDAPETR